MSDEIIFRTIFGLSFLVVIGLWIGGIDYINKNKKVNDDDFFDEEENRKDYDEN